MMMTGPAQERPTQSRVKNKQQKKTVGDQKRDWPWQVRSPKPMQVEISTEYGANVWGKPRKGVQTQ